MEEAGTVNRLMLVEAVLWEKLRIVQYVVRMKKA